jgi:hemerythrin-like domain-containing protein
MAKDVFSMLEKDHRRVERMLAQLSQSEEGPEREQTVQQLGEALELHMAFEESHVYPLVPASVDDETAEEAQVEHGLARDGLTKLREMTSAPGFGAVVDMVTAGIGHHVREEEGEVFPALRKELDDDRRQELAANLQQMREQAGMDSSSDLEDATKEELLEAAREAGIDGRSSMSKDQLRAALLKR